MPRAATPGARWTELDGKRQSFIRRVETCAGYTLPKLCLPQGYNQNSQSPQQDYQAFGAQAVNHLSNKIMLALFAPSRPFFRLDLNREVRAELEALGMDTAKIDTMLALGEKEAVKELDRMSLRPKLYETIKHLIVAGNVAIELGEKSRVYGLKKYVVRRDGAGRVLEAIIKDVVSYEELSPAVREVTNNWSRYKGGHSSDENISHYRWIVLLPNGDYSMTQWLDDNQLPAQFGGKWPQAKLPYQFLTWDLADGDDYGTGLVEDYFSDFAGLSLLSRAQIMGALLASEFRWLVNPAGMTSVEDVRDSENGAAIPGNEGDVTIVQSNKAGDLEVVARTAQEYITRIGRGFLFGSAVTRDAERVTAEEIRMQANELETALGGAYSRLAVDAQIPLANFLMVRVGFKIEGKEIQPSIVTGLDALSRTGDLDELKMFLADLGALNSLPPALLAKLDLEGITSKLAAGRRINPQGIILSPEQQAQQQEAAIAAQAANAAAEGGVAVAQELATQQEQ